MPETIIVKTFEEAEQLATTSYWVEAFYFAETYQGETAEDRFNKEYQITERNESDLAHYSKMNQ